jgi:hypothetical protein
MVPLNEVQVITRWALILRSACPGEPRDKDDVSYMKVRLVSVDKF